MEDTSFLDKYKSDTEFYHTASGRCYAAVIGSKKDGLLLNLTVSIKGFAKTPDNGTAMLSVATVRSLIKGSTYKKDFDLEHRDGEYRLEKKEFAYALTKDIGQEHLFEILTSSTFFKDLEKSLKFHGSTLNKDQLQEILGHTLPKLHLGDVLIQTDFAFNF